MEGHRRAGGGALTGMTRATRSSLSPANRATVTAVLAAVAVLATAVAVWAGVRAQQLSEPGDNAALADPRATREVTDRVTQAVQAVFSYDYGNLARTERAADSMLAGDAVGQYERGFADARERARAQRLVRTTTVRSVGVRSLGGDEARVLALLDQQTLHTAEGNRRESNTTALELTVERRAGEWKITDLTTW